MSPEKKTTRITKSPGPTFSNHFSLAISRLQDREESVLRKVARKPQESWERRVPHSGTPALGALTFCTEISVKIFRQMVLVFFLAPKTGTGLSCTIYKIQVNFSLSLDLKPGTGYPNKWYRKFRSFGKNEKRYYLERYYFFLGKFPPG